MTNFDSERSHRVPVTAEEAAAVYRNAPLDGSWALEFERDDEEELTNNLDE